MARVMCLCVLIAVPVALPACTMGVRYLIGGDRAVDEYVGAWRRVEGAFLDLDDTLYVSQYTQPAVRLVGEELVVSELGRGVIAGGFLVGVGGPSEVPVYAFVVGDNEKEDEGLARIAVFHLEYHEDVLDSVSYVGTWSMSVDGLAGTSRSARAAVLSIASERGAVATYVFDVNAVPAPAVSLIDRAIVSDPPYR